MTRLLLMSHNKLKRLTVREFVGWLVAGNDFAISKVHCSPRVKTLMLFLLRQCMILVIPLFLPYRFPYGYNQGPRVDYSNNFGYGFAPNANPEAKIGGAFVSFVVSFISGHEY